MPIIQDELARNGSPHATFETDEERLCFIVNIPAHEILKRDDETLQLDLSQDITKGMSQDNTLENRLLKLLSQDVSHDMSHDVSHDEKNAIASLKDAENLRIVIILLFMALEPVKLERLMQEAKETNRSRFVNRFIKPLISLGWLQRTLPDKPKSKNQAYRTTDVIRTVLEGKTK